MPGEATREAEDVAILLDSAKASDASEAASLGYVAGVTTNPKLLGGAEPFDRLGEILAAIPDVPVFHQLSRIDDADDAIAEAREAVSLDPSRIVIKVPTRPELLTVAARLVDENVPCAMTAIFSRSQAAIAGEIGVSWVIPYVDRTDRLGGDGIALVAGMRGVLDAAGAPTRVMAGSIKDPETAADALTAGADDVTVGLGVIRAMGSHEWSEQSIEAFKGEVGGKR